LSVARSFGEHMDDPKETKSLSNATHAENAGDDIFGYMAGKVKIVRDVVGPIAALEDWKCMRAAAR
jgi:hypothetical protein